jgi:hypothetical protein
MFNYSGGVILNIDFPDIQSDPAPSRIRHPTMSPGSGWNGPRARLFFGSIRVTIDPRLMTQILKVRSLDSWSLVISRLS